MTTLLEDILARADLAQAVEDRDCVAIAAAMSKGRPKTVPVTRQNFLVWAAAQNAYATIKDIADGKHNVDGDPLGQLRSSALTLIAFMYAGGSEVLDLSIPSVGALFKSWLLLGAINPAQYDALVAFSQADDIISARDVAVALYNDDGSAR
ncbi:MAG: hypothetical protein JWN23_1552 [Rhodocyclales bacterium]|nr:hypothetical protein [Rhodocyclales bacterium]